MRPLGKQAFGQQVSRLPAAMAALALLLGLVLVLVEPPGGGLAVSANADANRLYEDLMMTYNRIVRPIQNNSDKVVVRLGLKLSQLIDVNLKNQVMTINIWLNQEWFDYKLKWDPSEYGGIEDINLPTEQIWIPDIVLYNSAEGYFAVSIMTKAKVRYDGHVTWNPPAIFRSSCQIDITYFPFDSQVCHLKFGSWTYGTKIDLRHINDTDALIEHGTDLSEYYQNVEWDIMQASAKRNVITYTCCPNDIYPDVTFYFKLRRKPLFYTVNLILPCIGITILSFLVFYLPSDSGEKVTLTISILVSLIFFLSVLIETIPSTSLAMPLLGKYLVFTMILITVSVCATVCVLNIHFRTPSTHSMPAWIKRWCIDILPKYLFMSVPRHQSQQASVLPEQLIYLHNQAYASGAAEPTRESQVALHLESSSLVKQLKEYNQKQVVRRPHDTKRLRDGSQAAPDGDQIADNQLILSPSSLFLPFLQSEAARRLQLQRSRSSERDNRSTCDNSTPSSQRQPDSGRAANANQCDTSGQLAPKEAQTDRHRQPERRRSFWERISGRRKRARTGGQQERGRTNNQASAAPASNEINSSQEEDNRARSRPGLSQDTSSSFENDYLHHRHFQARASICSTNVWRIGPARRCSVAVPNCYPTYYKPQVNVTTVDVQQKHRHQQQPPMRAHLIQAQHHQNGLDHSASVDSFSAAGTGRPAGALALNKRQQVAVTNRPPQANHASSTLSPANNDIVLNPARLLPQQIMVAPSQQPLGSLARHPAGLGQTHLWPPVGISSQFVSDRIGEPSSLASGQPRNSQAADCPPQWPPPPPPPAPLGLQSMLDPSGARPRGQNHWDWHAPTSRLPRSSSSGDHGLAMLQGQHYLAHPLQANGRPDEQLGCGLTSAGKFESECSLFNGRQQLAPVSLDFNRTPEAHLAGQEGSHSIGRALGRAYLQRLGRQPTLSGPSACGPSSASTNLVEPPSLLCVDSNQSRPSRSNQRANMVRQHQQQPHHPGATLRPRSAHQSSCSHLDAMRRSRSQTSLAHLGAPRARQGQQQLHGSLVDYCKQCAGEPETPPTLSRSPAICTQCDYHLPPACEPARQHLTVDDSEPSGGFSGARWPSRSLAVCSGASGRQREGSAPGTIRARHQCNYGASVRSQKVLASCDGSADARPMPDGCCRATAYKQPGKVASRPTQGWPVRSAQAPLTSLGLMKLISEVDKAIQNAMFIAQHIDNLDEFESVKENWKFIAMVIDRIFLIVFLFACILGTVTIFAMVPWSYYTSEKPIDLQLTRLIALNFTGDELHLRASCRD